MDRETLLKMIEEDDSGILGEKPRSFDIQNAEDRLLASFQEISDFIKENGREPSANIKDIKEFALHSRLIHFRQDIEKIKLLQNHDQLKILRVEQAITSLEDVFKDDDMGILEDWMDSIFEIKHIPKETTHPDYVAQRQQCQNFNKYEHLFTQCHADLASGKRRLLPFAMEQQINENDFFVLKGILTYVARVGEKEIKNGRKNARLHCIFENGTESDMLLLSLARELYKDGRRVTIHENQLLDGLNGIESGDKETGWIYILKSLSQRSEIQSIRHLYKIGFSSTPIVERIKNAPKEPTYLMDSVSLIASYQCYNLNPQKFELLLHTFFAAACLNVDVFDKDGQRHTPREWFIVPLRIINQAVELLISGDIINYRYDHYRQEIIERE